MPPLETTLPITAPGQHWFGTKKTNPSNLRPDHPSKENASRRVTFLSEEGGSGNNHGSERREWDSPQDEDDDVSALTDVFPGNDIESPKGLLQELEEESEEEEDEERQHLTQDPLTDDESLEKMLEDSDECMNPFAEVREVFPLYNQACENVVLQVGDFVDAVKNCKPCAFAGQDNTNTSNNAPPEHPGLVASLWDQARRFLDPPTPPPIPTVLSSENTLEIYPDSSVSFAEGEILAVVPAANIPQEKDTVGHDPEQPGLSQRGLLDNVKERSSDDAPPDEANMTRPSPADLNKKPFQRTALFDPSETSHASVSTGEEDRPRPYGQSRRRSRCFIFLFLVLAFCTLLGIGFGAAGTKERQQIEEKLVTRDPSSTSVPTLSPSKYINEASAGTTLPTTNSSSPTVAPSEMASPIPTLAAAEYPTVAPTPLPTPSPTLVLAEVPASTPTMAPTTSPTDPITTSMPTIDPIEAAKKQLPYYPVSRFVPWTDVTVSLQLLLQQLLGYNEESWNLPGSINNNGVDYSRFWESQSYTTIQNTASVEVLSAVISMGFGKSEWDCWMNHYQNFTWAELETLAHINAGNEKGSEIQMAMTTFGWTESNWSTVERLHYFFPTTEEGLGARSPWANLSVTEQAAATRLCYTQELWDRVPLNY